VTAPPDDLLASLARAAIEPAAPEPLRVLTLPDWETLATLPGYQLAALWVEHNRAFGLVRRDDWVVPIATDDAQPAIAVMRRAHPSLALAQRSGAFADAPSEGVYQIGEGPVGGEIAEPMHRRLYLAADRVVRAEHRFGYAHRGIVTLIEGKSPRAAVRFAARIAGLSAVAHALAFSRAAEAASGATIPAPVAALREAMVATERCVAGLLALARLAEICVVPHLAANLIGLRTDIADAAESIFFHRLMMDMVVPGGIDTAPRLTALPALIARLQSVPALLQPFGAWRWRRRWADLAEPVRLWVRQTMHAAAFANSAFAPFAASATTASATTPSADPWSAALPSHSGAGLGQAHGLDGPIYCWMRLDGGFITVCTIANQGPTTIAALEAAAPGLTRAAFARRAALLMPPIGMIDL
jgi:hypothetical protein